MLVLAVLALCATVLTVWFTGKPLLDRLVSVRERTPERPPPPSPVAVPADLVLWASGAGQEWAKDQTLAWIRDVYQQTQDWDAVRRVVSSEPT